MDDSREDLERRLRKSESEKEALREELAILKPLFSDTTQLVYIVDPVTRTFLDANEAALAFLGYEREEMSGVSIDDVAHPDDREQAHEAAEEVMEAGSGEPAEYRLRRKDGEFVHAILNSRRVTYKGRPAIAGVARDITVEKQAKTMLEASLAMHESLVESLAPANVGIMAVDDERVIRWKNDEIDRLIEAVGGDPSAGYCHLAFRGADTPCSSCDLETMASCDETTVDDMKAGDMIWNVVTRRIPDPDNPGRFLKVEIVRDITEQRKKEEWFRALLENFPEIMFTIDSGGNFTSSEGRNLSALGLKNGEVVGQSAIGINKDYLDGVEGIVRALKGETLRRTVSVQGVERELHFDTTFSPMVSPITGKNETLGVAIDVTDRVIAKEAREAATRKQQELSRHFLTTLSVLADVRERGGVNHMIRVARYSVEIATMLNLSADTVREIEMFAPHHDIGKGRIPPEVYNHARPLTPEEYKVIQRHTEYGGLILGPELGKIALTHHENFDGTGYPSGLKGKLIPIEGRVVRWADVFDAFISDDRLYRQGESPDTVFRYMQVGDGQKRSDGRLRLDPPNDFDPAILSLMSGRKYFDRMVEIYYDTVRSKVSLEHQRLSVVMLDQPELVELASGCYYHHEGIDLNGFSDLSSMLDYIGSSKRGPDICFLDVDIVKDDGVLRQLRRDLGECYVVFTTDKPEISPERTRLYDRLFPGPLVVDQIGEISGMIKDVVMGPRRVTIHRELLM